MGTTCTTSRPGRRVAIVGRPRHAVRQERHRLPRRCRDGAWRHAARELLIRADLDGARDRRSGLRAGGPVGAGAQRRARGRPAPRLCRASRPTRSTGRARRGAGHHRRGRPDRAGDADAVIAGGAESLSDIPMLTRPLRQTLVEAGKAQTLARGSGRSRACARATSCPRRPPSPSRPRGSPWASPRRRWRRRTASPARSRTRSPSEPPARRGRHRRRPPGRRDRSVFVPPALRAAVTADNLLRARHLAGGAGRAAGPVFDRRYGTVTAGNSSPLTDGAAAVLLMSEDKAAARGLRAAAFVRALGRGRRRPGRPAADGAGARRAHGPRARGRRSSSDIDLIEMHEAFAAQVALEHPGPRVRRPGRASSSGARRRWGRSIARGST